MWFNILKKTSNIFNIIRILIFSQNLKNIFRKNFLNFYLSNLVFNLPKIIYDVRDLICFFMWITIPTALQNSPVGTPLMWKALSAMCPMSVSIWISGFTTLHFGCLLFFFFFLAESCCRQDIINLFMESAFGFVLLFFVSLYSLYFCVFDLYCFLYSFFSLLPSSCSVSELYNICFNENSFQEIINSLIVSCVLVRQKSIQGIGPLLRCLPELCHALLPPTMQKSFHCFISLPIFGVTDLITFSYSVG